MEKIDFLPIELLLTDEEEGELASVELQHKELKNAQLFGQIPADVAKEMRMPAKEFIQQFLPVDPERSEEAKEVLYMFQCVGVLNFPGKFVAQRTLRGEVKTVEVPVTVLRFLLPQSLGATAVEGFKAELRQRGLYQTTPEYRLYSRIKSSSSNPAT